MMLVCYLLAVKNDYPRQPWKGWKELWNSFTGAFWALMLTALIILFPTLLAVATKVGIDPVHFATFAVLNLMIGLTTPPVGVCLFVCANIAKAPLSSVIKAIFPFLVGNIIVLLLVSFIPQLSLWLPNLLFGGT